MSLWQTRSEAIDLLATRYPSRVDVLQKTFDLFDSCIDAYENAPETSAYSRVCAVALLKAKNLALGAYSLVLDGLGQEAGALLRPMIEYAEIITFLRLRPEMAEAALNNRLPKAGERAKVIESIYKQFREYLNENASHSSFLPASVDHLFDAEALRLRKRQVMVPHVLERNLTDLVVQLHVLLYQAVLSLERTGSERFLEIGERYDRLKTRMFDVYGLHDG